MSELILKHLDALAASMAIVNVQIEAARHAVALGIVKPKIRVELPPRCNGVDREECALQDGEWNRSRATFGAPNVVTCNGCSESREGATGE